MTDLVEALRSFYEDKKNKFKSKGALAVALVVTRHARNSGLPLDPEALLTESRAQVRGMGKAAIQKILEPYGIDEPKVGEAGRTNRGSVMNMYKYTMFLNELSLTENFDIEAVERFWIERVREVRAAVPFKISNDSSLGLRALVRGVLELAQRRQKENTGMQYVGAVMQHLVGAKLDCALGRRGCFEHHSFSTSDALTGRAGDFVIGDVAIHVTTTPGEAVVERCRGNIDNNLKPIVVTLGHRVATVENIADDVGLGGRIDVFEIEQFIALNLYELGGFSPVGRKTAVNEVVSRYNEIVEKYESDHSLKIELPSG